MELDEENVYSFQEIKKMTYEIFLGSHEKTNDKKLNYSSIRPLTSILFDPNDQIFETFHASQPTQE